MADNRLFPPANNNDQSSSNERTDPKRGMIFSGDQQIWARRCMEAEGEIGKMINMNKSLFEIYEYARKTRASIAEELEKNDVSSFGSIRIRDGRDMYNRQQYAGAKGNLENLLKMKQILLAQNLNQKEISNESIEMRKLKQNQIFIEHGPDRKIMEYTALPRNENDLTVRMYTSSARSDEVFIRVDWGYMDDEIYSSKLKRLDKQLQEFSNPEIQGDEALYRIGLLAYDLTRLMLLQRGSAAVNGWIIRELAKAKGFVLGVMTVKGLTIDIYAEIQSNREQYAKDFAESLKMTFSPDKTQSSSVLK